MPEEAPVPAAVAEWRDAGPSIEVCGRGALRVIEGNGAPQPPTPPG